MIENFRGFSRTAMLDKGEEIEELEIEMGMELRANG